MNKICLENNKKNMTPLWIWKQYVYYDIEAYPIILRWLWEYVYFILLLSSNRKYDPFAIV